MSSKTYHNKKVNLKNNIQSLLLKQEFYWFLGHFFTIIFFIFYAVFSFIKSYSTLKYYRRTLLSALISYFIVIKQVHYKKTNNFQDLLSDENFYYFLLSLIFYGSSYNGIFTGACLYSYVIFAFLHVINYTSNTLLVLIPFKDQTNLEKVTIFVNYFKIKYQENLLFVSTNSELFLVILNLIQLVPNFFYDLLFKKNYIYFYNKLFIAISLVIFSKAKYDLNYHFKFVLTHIDIKINEFLIKFNNNNFKKTYDFLKFSILKNYICKINFKPKRT